MYKKIPGKTPCLFTDFSVHHLTIIIYSIAVCIFLNHPVHHNYLQVGPVYAINTDLGRRIHQGRR